MKPKTTKIALFAAMGLSLFGLTVSTESITWADAAIGNRTTFDSGFTNDSIAKILVVGSETVSDSASMFDMIKTTFTLGGIVGEISNATTDSLEYDTARGLESSIAHVSGNIYAIAYSGPGRDGFVKTINVTNTGIISNSVIDTLEFDTTLARTPQIIKIGNDTFAIAYRGPSSDGFIKTIDIDSAGNIANSVIDTLEFDTARGFTPNISNIDSDIFAIAYSGPGSDGFIKTVDIDSAGNIANSVIDTLEFDTARGVSPNMTKVGIDTFAVAYSGPGSDGFIKTVDIDSAGNIANSVIDTLEFDTVLANDPTIARTSNTIYAIAYSGPDTDGFIKTVDIDSAGNIANSVIDTLEFDTNTAIRPVLTEVGQNINVVAYSGPGSDGFIKTVDIDSAGNIANSVIDTLEFDTNTALLPDIAQVDVDTFIVSYGGPRNDGFVVSFDII